MGHGPDVHQNSEHCGQEGVHVALASGKCLKLLPEFGVKGLEVFFFFFLSATAMEKFVFLESRTWRPT